jgi:hypothetical protein
MGFVVKVIPQEYTRGDPNFSWLSEDSKPAISDCLICS